MYFLHYSSPKSSSHSETTGYTNSLSAIERNFKKAIRNNQAKAQYDFMVAKYMSVHNLYSIPMPFLYPFSYFKYYKQAVHYTHNKRFPLFENISATFHELLNLPHTPDCYIETQLLKALENYLKSCSKFSKYEILIFQYEEAERKEFPLYSFFLFDNSLCKWWKDNSFDLHCSILNKYFYQNYLTPVSQKEFKKWLPILKTIKKESVIPSFTYQKPENPFYMYIKSSNTIKSVCYDQNNRSFCVQNSLMTSLSSLYSSSINALPYLQETDISPVFHHTTPSTSRLPKVTNELIQFLLKLTNGNQQNLINLSLLFANIACPENLTSKLFLITTTKEKHVEIVEYIRGMLDVIFNPEENFYFSQSYPTINKLTAKTYVPSMANNFIQGTKLIVVSKGTTSLTDIQLKTLSKYIKGAKVTATDKLFGSVSFRNLSPIICFSSSHKEVSYLEQNLPCIRIDLDFITSSEELPMLSSYTFSDVCDWLRLSLPLFGLYLLAEKKIFHKPFPKKKFLQSSTLKDDITNDFLSVCCDYSPNSFIFADTLYNAYTVYYQTVHKSVPLKRTQFVSVLKRHSNLTYKRPHTSRKVPNKYAFIGITLRPNWEENIIASSKALSFEEELFKQKLEEISTLLPSPL